MKHIIYSLTVLLLTPMLASAVELTQPIKIETGLIQGALNADKDVVSFKGIPYAAPPVGALRWREPQPPLKWEGVRLMDAFGKKCPQVKFGTTNPVENTSEDCLFLNVWVPANASEKNLAVLFFVHGGCYQFGSGDFNGDGMAKKGIILVTANHRLGSFNLMGHPELTKESPLKSCSNYGSLDLIAALKWVQNNIAAFGGDPSKVTLSGQSTGSSNVHYLSASPMAKGLFRGLIAISFPYDFLMKPNAIGNMWQAEQSGLKLAQSKNIKTLEELRAIPAAELLKGVGGPTYRTPVYPDNYPTALSKGLVSDVPTITGMTSDDFDPPAQYDPYTTVELFKTRVARKCPPEKLEQVLAQYPAKTAQEAKEMWKKISVEFRLADIYHWAKKRAKTAKTPSYTYLFTHAQPLEPKRGAYHGSDMIYEFNNVAGSDKGWREEDRQVAEQVSSYWVNFVKTGNPNGPGLPEWKAFDPADPSTMVLGKESGPQPIAITKEAWKLLHEEERSL